MCMVKGCYNKDVGVSYKGYFVCSSCLDRHCKGEIDLNEYIKGVGKC
jgi:hypothetical protein